MAAPNLKNIATIFGNTDSALLTTTLTSIVTNSSSSGKVYKINTIMVSNIDGTNDAVIDVAFSDNGTARYLGYQMALPASTTLVITSRDQPIYLEENDSIQAKCNTSSDAHIVISYEDMAD